MQIRISEFVRGFSDDEASTNQTTASVGINQPKSYGFGAAPNSVYKVQIGFSASNPCQNIIDPAWTAPDIDECTTPVAGKWMFVLK